MSFAQAAIVHKAGRRAATLISCAFTICCELTKPRFYLDCVLSMGTTQEHGRNLAATLAKFWKESHALNLIFIMSMLEMYIRLPRSP